MFMALGAGVADVARLAVVAAMFHLFTHAFFKALLFLGSGSVMHAMGGVIDMRRFRGLRHRMPYTHWTFLVGALALSGIWPFAGFFSKDEILIALDTARHSERNLSAGWLYGTIYWVAVATAFMTAFYTFRAYFLTFWGPEKLPSPKDPEAEPEPVVAPLGDAAHHDTDAAHGHGSGHDDHFGHESGPVMTIPLLILAVCALAVGFLFGSTGMFEHHLARSFGFERLPAVHAHAAGLATPLIGLTAGTLGIGLAYLFYFKPSPVPKDIATRAKPLYQASLHKFYVDGLYEATVVKPTLILAKIVEFIDVYIVDGLVRMTAWVPRIVGRELLGPFQNGLIQFYAAVTALGVAGLLWILLLSRSS
jgi:NADH-quinone oxidoreductase subunit L